MWVWSVFATAAFSPFQLVRRVVCVSVYFKSIYNVFCGGLCVCVRTQLYVAAFVQDVHA